MKNVIKGLFVLAAGACALSANAGAQTVQFNGIGSSALFLELGQAASASTTGSPAGLGATCVWSTKTSGVVVATDGSSNGGGATDSGNAFVAWTPVNGSCSTVNSGVNIYAYLQTDSVVGDRCLFNGCTVKNTGAGTASAGLINGSSEVALPAAIETAVNGAGGTGLAVNAAGTDIRPEDAEFAITRALAPCGTAVVSGSQYLGLGYNNGDKIASYYSSSTFNVINFSLPSSYSVTPIGATPIVIVVNGNSSSNTGFNTPNLTDITSGTLAAFFDGTYNFTTDALTVVPNGYTRESATVLVREPLSGTYNTFEYNVTNTQSQKTSQDVGFNQLAAQQNCNGTAVKNNPLNNPSGAGYRRRAIGTGQELSEVITRQDSIGYGFWSVANFKGFTSSAAPNAKYLTVDGVDPILNSYSSNYSTPGTIPTTANEIANVTLANVANGDYGIWSDLRLVNLGSSPNSIVTSLATAAQGFVANTTQPDFIPFNNLLVVRSHFIPPAGAGEPTTASNGTARACSPTEVGGDVGGVVLIKTGDYDFCYDYSITTGETGRRK